MYDNCLTWPSPRHFDPILTEEPPIVPPTLPILILSADLDSVTSRGDAEQSLQQLGPSARLVSIPNENHAPALADPFNCAERIVREFVVAPKGPPNVSCTQHIPEIRTVGLFPKYFLDEPPATPLPGNRANATELRLAAVAVAAIGDAIYGMPYVLSGDPPNCGNDYCGVGLRGGSYRIAPDGMHVALDRMAYALGTSVSGTVSISGIPTAAYVSAHGVRAELSRSTLSETLEVSWDQRKPRELAVVRGRTSSGDALCAMVPAP